MTLIFKFRGIVKRLCLSALCSWSLNVSSNCSSLSNEEKSNFLWWSIQFGRKKKDR